MIEMKEAQTKPSSAENKCACMLESVLDQSPESLVDQLDLKGNGRTTAVRFFDELFSLLQEVHDLVRQLPERVCSRLLPVIQRLIHLISRILQFKSAPHRNLELERCQLIDNVHQLYDDVQSVLICPNGN
mgnify:CR=1 FL=1